MHFADFHAAEFCFPRVSEISVSFWGQLRGGGQFGAVGFASPKKWLVKQTC